LCYQPKRGGNHCGCEKHYCSGHASLRPNIKSKRLLWMRLSGDLSNLVGGFG
jgi:hypothetical protein